MYNWDELIRCALDISETPYQRRSRQLKEYIQAKLDISNVRVSRSSVGNKCYYNVKIIGDVELFAIQDLFGDIPTGLVEYVSETKKHIYLIDEDRLHDKYLKNGDLVFEEPFNFIDAFHKRDEDKIKEQSDKIVAVFCDNVSDLCLIYIKEWASPTGVLKDLKVKDDGEYWSHSHNMMVINMEYVELEE